MTKVTPVDQITKPHFGMKLQLEGRSNSASAWGCFRSIWVDAINPNEAVETAFKRAVAYLDNQAAQWMQNYDPNLSFRIVS